MHSRQILIGATTAALASLALASVALAQDPTESEAPEPAPVIETREGTVESTQDADGRAEYQLSDGSSVIELGVGPPWFYGDNHPLAGLVGQSVTVTGEVDDGTPAAQAGELANADGQPSFDVFTLNGTEIRPLEGKPAWAGGPAAVGESHPGYAGWSQGQAAADAAGGNAP